MDSSSWQVMNPLEARQSYQEKNRQLWKGVVVNILNKLGSQRKNIKRNL